MSVIRAPKLFKCAIGYAGIYDLAMMYKKGDIREHAAGRNYLTTVIGKDDAALAANSPDHLAGQIDVPVLLIHGKADQRAPFAQAKAMRAALDAAHKPYEWLAKPDEGHGFYAEANNVERLDTMQAFLAKHIGKGAAAP
jgi:dipeptidyl aminopeptidase/acylaminoacyl peptidase